MFEPFISIINMSLFDWKQKIFKENVGSHLTVNITTDVGYSDVKNIITTRSGHRRRSYIIIRCVVFVFDIRRKVYTDGRVNVTTWCGWWLKVVYGFPFVDPDRPLCDFWKQNIIPLVLRTRGIWHAFWQLLCAKQHTMVRVTHARKLKNIFHKVKNIITDVTAAAD